MTGDHGILTITNEAKNKTEESSKIEEINLIKNELSIEYNTTGKSESKLLSNGNQIYIDYNGNFAIISKVFIVSGYSDENTIKNGLVIYQTEDINNIS